MNINREADIIIITRNGWELTRSCIESLLLSETEFIFQITVVDNQSEDGTQENLKQLFPDIKLISNSQNLGYAKAVNMGMNNTAAPFAIIANNDLVFFKDTVQKLLSYLESDETFGCAGPQQLYPNGELQRSFGDLPGISGILKEIFFINFIKKPISKILSANRKPHQVPYLDGACLAVRRNAFFHLGGFDEDYFFFTEEADFCKRLRDMNYKVMLCPESRLIHLRGGGSGAARFDESSAQLLVSTKVLFSQKHHSCRYTRIFICLNRFNAATKKFIISFGLIFAKNQKLKEKYRYFNSVLIQWKKIKNEY